MSALPVSQATQRQAHAGVDGDAARPWRPVIAWAAAPGPCCWSSKR